MCESVRVFCEVCVCLYLDSKCDSTKFDKSETGYFVYLFFCFVLLITFIYLVPIIFVLYNIIDYAFLLAKPAAATESSALHSTNGVSNNNKRGE